MIRNIDSYSRMYSKCIYDSNKKSSLAELNCVSRIRSQGRKVTINTKYIKGGRAWQWTMSPIVLEFYYVSAYKDEKIKEIHQRWGCLSIWSRRRPILCRAPRRRRRTTCSRSNCRSLCEYWISVNIMNSIALCTFKVQINIYFFPVVSIV